MATALAGCNEERDAVDGADGTSGSPRAVEQDEGWCDVLEDLHLPEDVGEVDLADTPEEIRVALQFLAEAVDEGLTASRRVEVAHSLALVESWGHEHCGTVHPFCGVFAVVEQAFSGADPMQQEQILEDLDDELIRYAPDDLVRYAKDYVVRLDASLGRPAPSDYAQRDGEAATDVLRRWWSSNCPAARP